MPIHIFRTTQEKTKSYDHLTLLPYPLRLTTPPKKKKKKKKSEMRVASSVKNKTAPARDVGR